ncbi:cytochrome C biogenesis protein CcdA [Komagataeibacter nataicola]|uniref:Cytochrome C biogenesis protein CcdA n=1 Tax=Komagataeibacter nataicola TaxID=265960 RepID=A0A9N7H0Z7_9PROT|nr:cytochrome c [Komagataeibacter nataicola]AQU86580.1 cytochrome C biogenesis protein CcdA [Komagataeibacter nataicola]PYD66733.1 cytochrome C biogenesis protein CcdA [Komagataeibacter nataicola]WEQ56528.1 cytochrome c [Komagataeibacter nataicola]WNM08025.1 cytochrome c [Komagataeibacter nataicola]GBR22713.1 cytochrome c class I [Komagataeibacter nataicola NRIC 0616]
MGIATGRIASVLRGGCMLAAMALLAACTRHGQEGYARYRTNCGICHHGGEGLKGEIPPITGRVDRIATSPEGRQYLMHVLLNGLNGPLKIDGVPYNFFMPSFRAHLSDEEIASILSYLATRGDTHPAPVFTAAEVARERTHPLSSSMVADERRRLDAIHPLP